MSSSSHETICLNRKKLDNESSANFVCDIRSKIRKLSLIINTICIFANLRNVRGILFYGIYKVWLQ